MKHILITLSLLLAFNGYTKEPKRLIKNYGNFKQVSNIEFEIPKRFKAVFDVYTSNDDKEKVNGGINTVARYLNMHYDAGVKLKNIKTAIVIHGAAGKDILKNSAYNKYYETDNPNAELLKQLHDNGVRIIFCGQTGEFRSYERDEIVDFVDISLSAITALLSLQSQGYGLINFN